MLTKETLEKLEEMSKPIVHISDENEFVINHAGEINQIREELDFAETFRLSSLDALVQMIKTEAFDLYNAPIYIEAVKYGQVICFLQPKGSLRYSRQIIYDVLATDVPGWDVKDALPFEEALIAVRTRFQQSPDTEYLLKLLSEISNGAKVTFADNGVATTIVTKKGIDLQHSESIRPIISLAPYRTFQEIEQPASQFHIRISERGIRFIEADGGMWKLAARKTIVEYFEEHLSEAVADGRVVVML